MQVGPRVFGDVGRDDAGRDAVRDAASGRRMVTSTGERYIQRTDRRRIAG
jgi:hypothetical protein